METDELPDGWHAKPLRDCVAPKEIWNARRNPRQRIRYVELAGIDNARGVIASTSDIEAATAPSRAKKVIRKGDVLFATTRPNLKNIAVVPPELDGEICSTGFCVLRPKPEIAESGWIFCVTRSDWFVNQVVRHDEKNAYPSVSDGKVMDVEIPVPPLAEQRRLVGRVDAFTARLAQACKARQAAIGEGETLFPKMLSVAFCDETTADWDEYPADALFKIGPGRSVLLMTRTRIFRISAPNTLSQAPAGSSATVYQCPS